MKATPILFVAAVLSACGQSYTPGIDKHVAGPQGGGTVFGSGNDATPYRTVDVSMLESTITETLGVQPVAIDANCVSPDACPVSDPVAYLEANKASLGAPVYGDAGSQAPGMMTSGGVKVWVQSATSACGLMMAQPSPALFPAGIADYSNLFVSLLGRAPTPAEITALDALRTNPALTSDAKRGAAVCGAVLGSMEFLQAN